MKTFGTVFSQRVLSILEKHKCDEISVEATQKFVYDMLEPTGNRGDLLYRFEHSVRVAVHAKTIAQAEGLPERDLVLAGLLHDVGYRECITPEDFDFHQLVSADIAREYLWEIGYPAEAAGEMVTAISRHNLTDRLPEDMSLFQMTVRDCDDIDRFDMIRTSAVLGRCVTEKTNDEIISLCHKEIEKAEWVMSLKRGTETAKSLIKANGLKRVQLLEDVIRQAKRGLMTYDDGKPKK